MITALKTDQILTKRSLFIALAFVATFSLLGLMSNKSASAANEEGFGFAVPGSNSNASGVSCGGNLRTSVWVFIKDINNNSQITAGIRMRNVANGNTVTTLANNLRIDCIDVNQGLWLAVWGLGSYRHWDNAVNFIGLNEQYNFCCGFKSLDTTADNGKLVIYNIYLEPSAVTINATTSIGTALPGQIYNATGPTYPVPLNFITRSPIPGGSGCGGGSQRINRFIWLRNISTGQQILGPGGTLGDGNVDGFGFINPPGPLGVQEFYTANLPVGQYQWYAQYQENARRCGTLTSIPISGQIPFNFFTVQAAQPNLHATITPPGGSISAGQNVTFTGQTVNNGTANTPGQFFVRFCLDPGLPCYGNASNVYGPAAALVGPLNAGTSLGSTSTNWVATAGTHTIWYCADVNGPPGAVTETNENQSDNCASSTFTVTAPRPDLTASITAFTAPTVGQTITFNATTRNIGTASTGAQFFVRFCLDPSLVCYGNVPALNLGPVASFIGPLNAGSSQGSVSNSWTATAGTHRIWFCADVNGPPGAITPESNENNNCDSIPFTVAAPAPNLVVNSLTNIGTVTVGTPVILRAVVQNTGLVNSGANQGRFCFNTSMLTCYTTSTNQIGSLRPIRGFIPLDGDPIDSDLWTPTSIAPVTIWFCADVNRPGVVPEGINEDDNCRSLLVTPSGNTSWLQTVKGDVGSQSRIGDLDHSSGQNSADYLVVSNKAINASISTLKSWLVPNYNNYTLPTPNHYNFPAGNQDTLLGKFGSNFTAVNPPGTQFPQAAGTYHYTGDVTWNGYVPFVAGSCNNDTKTRNSVIILIDGNLTVGSQPGASSCPTVIIVGKDTTINGSVTSIDAILITEGALDTGNSTNTLSINGSVMYRLNGGGSGCNPPPANCAFNRDNSGNGGPAEKITYEPKYLWILASTKLGKTQSSFEEKNP